MKDTEFCARPPVTAGISIVAMALLLVSTSCSLCNREPSTTADQLAAPYRILVTAEQMTDPNTILIRTLFLACPDGGQQLIDFLKHESLLPSGQKMVTENSEEHYKLVPGDFNEPDRMSLELNAKPLKPTIRNTYCLTTQQQERLQGLPQVQTIASPEAKVTFGKLAQVSVITEEYYMISPPSKDPLASQSELQCIESGMKLDLTPNLTQNEDEITIDLKLEISDSIPSNKPSGLPIVTRRKSSYKFTMNRNGCVLFVSPVPHEESISTS